MPSRGSAVTGPPSPGEEAHARSAGQSPGPRKARKGGPPTLRVNIKYVGGDEGRILGIAQGNALRRVLEALDKLEEQPRQQEE